MNPDALPDLDDRINIIAGEARLSPEKAKDILARLAFYPPVGHDYCASICGRMCDIDCYVHLEKSGKLKKALTPSSESARSGALISRSTKLSEVNNSLHNAAGNVP